MRTRAATLADVGRAAGVSAMAASAVLNSARTTSRIPETTRRRILEAAARLRYRPNAAARALAARRMNTIGVATRYDDGTELNYYFLEILKGVLQAAAHFHQNTTVFTFHDWSEDVGQLSRFCDGRIDGMILVAPVFNPDDLRQLPDHTPFVSTHANIPIPGAINLEADEENGMFELIRYLTSRGHHRIVHFAGPHGLLGAERRIRGYQSALAESNIAFDAALIVEAGFTTADGYEATRRWLREHKGEPLPDAISCSNDGAAIGCLSALAEAGIQVPGDVSVVGFDDTLAARTTVPQLTTVRQPLPHMGEKAVEILMDAVPLHHEPPAAATEPITFPTELVIRASVADRT